MAYYENYLPDENGVMHKVVINAGVGFVLPYYGETAPPGTLACDGSEISRAVYDELFQVLGTLAGAGDGSTTFNLPDLRGQFVRGLGGTNSDDLGVEQGDAIRNLTGHLNAANSQALCSAASGVFTATTYYNTNIPNPAGTQRQVVQLDFSASNQVSTADENRPVNVALLWCIIYE